MQNRGWVRFTLLCVRLTEDRMSLTLNPLLRGKGLVPWISHDFSHVLQGDWDLESGCVVQQVLQMRLRTPLGIGG